jgi:hypothetical protein
MRIKTAIFYTLKKLRKVGNIPISLRMNIGFRKGRKKNLENIEKKRFLL